jgi:hypothetical protein
MLGKERLDHNKKSRKAPIMQKITKVVNQENFFKNRPLIFF